jgi:pimeloyl-ACP methyl ester carboxylesterase
VRADEATSRRLARPLARLLARPLPRPLSRLLSRRPAPAGGRSGLVLHLARETWWRVQDYVYVLLWQARGVLRRGGAEVYLEPEHPVPPAVVLIPGVYESWQFMRPLADLLHRNGHPVHVLPTLGYNRGPIPAGAALVARYLDEADLRDVVLVAHSKGGLIGKLAMLQHDPEGRIRAMVAINTPFAGSVYARFVPLRAVRAFVPTDATLVALAAEQDVNRRIASVYSCWDPHIPAGSVLEGATNVELGTPGHFRALGDHRLEEVVVGAVRAAAATISTHAGGMTTFETRIRVPGAIDQAAVEPYAQQLLQHPTDGEILEHDAGSEAGSVRLRFLADDQADAEMHARLLAERAPGCEVEDVRPVDA